MANNFNVEGSSHATPCSSNNRRVVWPGMKISGLMSFRRDGKLVLELATILKVWEIILKP